MVMASRAMIVGLGTVAAVLIGAAPLPSLSQLQPGLWEIDGVPDAKTPVRQCIADVAILARFEHQA